MLLRPGAARHVSNVAAELSGGGLCRSCRAPHYLPRSEESDAAALALLETIRRTGRLDFDAAVGDSRLSSSTKYRTAEAPRQQGQMLGVLIAIDRAGAKHQLKSFSGQLNWTWLVPGWAEPLCSLRHDSADGAYRLAFRRIKALGEEAAAAAAEAAACLARAPAGRAAAEAAAHEERRIQARQAQRAISNALLVRLRRATMLPNFRGELVSVEEASLLGDASSGGTGDCAAPKLLAAAARARLAPLALSELWFGSGPPAGGRVEETFYPPCQERCTPILGYMLCGAAELRAEYGVRSAGGVGG